MLPMIVGAGKLKSRSEADSQSRNGFQTAPACCVSRPCETMVIESVLSWPKATISPK
jgi:hypothetical protein